MHGRIDHGQVRCRNYNNFLDEHAGQTFGRLEEAQVAQSARHIAGVNSETVKSALGCKLNQINKKEYL